MITSTLTTEQTPADITAVSREGDKPYRPGRPSKFSPELVETVCQHLISGKSLNQVGKMQGMPTKQTLINWLHDPKKKAFWAQYKRAREIQARMLDNDIVNTVEASEMPRTLTPARLTAPARNY